MRAILSHCVPWAAISILAALPACGRGTRAPAELARLAEEYWEGYLVTHPTRATLTGDRRYDDRLEDITPEGRSREQVRLKDVLLRARAIAEEELSAGDRLTRSALISQVEADLAARDCRLEEWVVDPMDGPQTDFQNIESYQPVNSVEDGRNMIRRWEAMGPYLDAHVVNLRRGLSEGRVAVRVSVLKVIEQIDELLGRPEADSPLLRPLRQERPEWPEPERASFRDGLTAAVKRSIYPALERYRGFLKDEVLPAARPEDRPGLVHVPGGEDCYRRLIRVFTSLERPAEDIHQLGLAEVGRINLEIETLGQSALGSRERRDTLRRLRTDPGLHFRSRDEVEGKAQTALSRARAAIPGWFGTLPRAACEVVRMEPHEEEHSTIAYYREPAADGSRPGRYYINTSAPGTRPRYEAEALAYHEAIPGHHLQVAVSQELGDLPSFRRYLGATAFVEGWALYAERLSDEMGLYSGELDRLGMLSYDAWRACRLVVDSGLHAKGWTRRQAIDFMLQNTALAENNIVNEVDRYINWPGQALAYKAGQLEIVRLRGEAKRRLGERFDIKAFHDAVLRHGAVTLDVLGAQIEEYIRQAAAADSMP
jgi:uncharacterized protein (DUF885 family)